MTHTFSRPVSVSDAISIIIIIDTKIRSTFFFASATGQPGGKKITHDLDSTPFKKGQTRSQLILFFLGFCFLANLYEGLATKSKPLKFSGTDMNNTSNAAKQNAQAKPNEKTDHHGRQKIDHGHGGKRFEVHKTQAKKHHQHDAQNAAEKEAAAKAKIAQAS